MGGPSIGDNGGNAIYAKPGNGIVYHGAVRDINRLEELPNFTSFVRSYDPSHHYGSLRTGKLLNSTMVSINGPVRIGRATAMPADVVLGRNGGVMFIPPQLVEKVVRAAVTAVVIPIGPPALEYGNVRRRLVLPYQVVLHRR